MRNLEHEEKMIKNLNNANRLLRLSTDAPEHFIIEPFTSFKVTVLLTSL